jgi:hypothetical protein
MPTQQTMETASAEAYSNNHPRLNSCPDPLHRGCPILFREKFIPLGTTIQVESNDEAVIQAAVESFGRYGGPPSAARPEILLQLCVDPERHDRSPWPKPSYRALKHIFHIACGDTNFAVADLDTGSAFGFVSREMAQDRSFFRYTFLECLFYVLVVRQSHTPVHCSSVALNGRGVLICGPSGVGKTTLAYACAQSGMQVVSDDVVHLCTNPATNEIALWGNPWCLRLLPEAVQLFPELIGEELKLRSDYQECLEIDVSSHFPDAALVSCRPVALVFLERGQEPTPRLYPISAELALGRLQQDIVLDEDSVVERHYSVLKRLVEVGTYALRYCGQPSHAVSVIEGLLRK